MTHPAFYICSIHLISYFPLLILHTYYSIVWRIDNTGCLYTIHRTYLFLFETSKLQSFAGETLLLQHLTSLPSGQTCKFVRVQTESCLAYMQISCQTEKKLHSFLYKPLSYKDRSDYMLRFRRYSSPRSIETFVFELLHTR